MPLLLPAGQNCCAFVGSQQTHSYGCRRIRPYVSAIIAIHTFNEWHPFHAAFKLIAVCLVPLIKPFKIILGTSFHCCKRIYNVEFVVVQFLITDNCKGISQFFSLAILLRISFVIERYPFFFEQSI